ncbi:MAG TPA: hypothetical protein VHA56_16875 [Mucilaginibacter sp.]|nr:hypothetical protein [Mucilaginibacter sp.]
MLTFDEFFKKKRIDLAALHKAEPGLFSEFKTHYEQMGEKSFDHTKKYWFNKKRREYPLPPEIKTEKPHIANPIAEQTITESLSEQAPAKPKMGFTPKFRAANIAKPAAESKSEVPADEPVKSADAAESAANKPAGFVPRFKAKPKPLAEEETSPEKSDEAASKPAYVPKFKMKPKTGEGTPPKQGDDTTAE